MTTINVSAGMTATEDQNELIGKRVLACNGEAVVITGAGTVKRVYPKVQEDIDVTELTKQSISVNNKVMHEKLDAKFPKEVSYKKGWFTVRGFKLRYAPQGFEMFDVANFKTPIDLGETPTIDEVLKFIEKPSIKKLTENRKNANKMETPESTVIETPAKKTAPKRKPAAPAATKTPKSEEKKVEEKAPEVAPLTDEEQRAAGIKLINSFARKDVRVVDTIKPELFKVVENRKYRTQLGKLVTDFLANRPAKQKAEYGDFIKTLRMHLKDFDFAPAPVKAPKFTGLEEIDFKGGITESSFADNKVVYKNKAGKRLEATLVHFLLHDVLYNWSDYNVVLMYLATGKQTLSQILEAGEYNIKDLYTAFDQKVIEAYKPEEMLQLLLAIYEFQEEATPLQFVWDAKLKVGSKIRVRWSDLKTSYVGEVINNMPVEINYTDLGFDLNLLNHQTYTAI